MCVCVWLGGVALSRSHKIVTYLLEGFTGKKKFLVDLCKANKVLTSFYNDGKGPKRQYHCLHLPMNSDIVVCFSSSLSLCGSSEWIKGILGGPHKSVNQFDL